LTLFPTAIPLKETIASRSTNSRVITLLDMYRLAVHGLTSISLVKSYVIVWQPPICIFVSLN